MSFQNSEIFFWGGEGSGSAAGKLKVGPSCLT